MAAIDTKNSNITLTDLGSQKKLFIPFKTADNKTVADSGLSLKNLITLGKFTISTDKADFIGFVIGNSMPDDGVYKLVMDLDGSGKIDYNNVTLETYTGAVLSFYGENGKKLHAKLSLDGKKALSFTIEAKEDGTIDIPEDFYFSMFDNVDIKHSGVEGAKYAADADKVKAGVDYYMNK